MHISPQQVICEDIEGKTYVYKPEWIQLRNISNVKIYKSSDPVKVLQNYL